MRLPTTKKPASTAGRGRVLPSRLKAALRLKSTGQTTVVADQCGLGRNAQIQYTTFRGSAQEARREYLARGLRAVGSWPEIEKARPEQKPGCADFSSTITLSSRIAKSTPGLSRPRRNGAENSRSDPKNPPPKDLMSCRLAFVTGAFCPRNDASQESLHNDTMDSPTGKRSGGKVKRSANVSSLRVLARIHWPKV
jgi:hypothetical protein